MSALKDCLSRWIVSFLILLSAFSIVFTMGMGIAGLGVDTEILEYTLLGVASGSAVVSSFLVALVAVLMIRGIEGDGPEGRTGEVELERGLPEGTAVTCGIKVTLNEADSTTAQFDRQPESNKKWQSTVTRFLFLFLIVLLLEFTPLSVLWGLFIAVTNAKHGHSGIPIHTYLLTEMLVGILPPVLIIASTVLATMGVGYTGSGKVDPRDWIAYCLPSVALFKGTKHDYWIIIDTFYIETKKPMRNTLKNWYPVYFKSFVTLGLAVIVSAILLESFSVFAALSVSHMETFDSCQEVGINTNTFTCYSGETWQRVNCSQNSTSHVLCFGFISVRSLIEVVPGSLVAAIAVAVGFIELFEFTFKAARALLRCKSAKVWGATVTSMGILILLVGPVQFILMFKFPVHYKPTVVMQTGWLGVYIITMGLLLVKIKWWEKPKEEKQEIELVSVGTPKSKRFGKDTYAQSRVTRRAKVPEHIEQTNHAGTNPQPLRTLRATDFTGQHNVVQLDV